MANQSSTFLSQLKLGFDGAEAGIEDGLLLAISGGADSMALLHAAVQLWPNNRHQLAVAHINHGLRGTESEADQALVQESASSLGVRFEVKILPSGQLQDMAKTSLEEAARNARYDWLSSTAVRLKAKFVVTAHHAEDQAETILHNIIRGTGLRGASGMRESRPLSDAVCLIRPMLSCERSDIELFVKQNGVEFRNDMSNNDSQFTRNRIRSQLLPFLKDSFNGQVVKSLNSLGTIANETADCMDQIARKVLAQSLLYADQQSCRLDTTCFAEWPAIIVRQCLIQLWTRLGWPRQKMTYRHWGRLADLATGASVAAVQFPGDVTASRAGFLLRLSRDSGLTTIRQPEVGA